MVELSSDMALPGLAGGMKLIWQGVPIMNCGVSRKISDSMQAGAEMTCITLPHGFESMGSIGGRYCNGEDTLTFQLGRTPDFKNQMKPQQLHGLKAQYHRKVS